MVGKGEAEGSSNGDEPASGDSRIVALVGPAVA